MTSKPSSVASPSSVTSPASRYAGRSVREIRTRPSRITRSGLSGPSATSMRIVRTSVSERSAQVVTDEPSTVTVSPAVVNTAVAAPRRTTLVSPSASLTRTKPGRSRSPSAMSASSTSSKPAPASTSAHRPGTRAFSDGGSTTVAWSPKMPNQSPGRYDRVSLIFGVPAEA